MLKIHIEDVHMKHLSHDDTASSAIEVISSETCYTCSACSYIGNVEELRTHIAKQHAACELCGSICANYNNLADHKKTQHNLYTCELCGLIFESFLSLKDHLESVHSLHLCDSCGLRFNDLDALKTHVIDEHEELVVLHTMASQVNDLHCSDSPFQVEVMKLLQKLLDIQNVLRQELFVLRTNGLTAVDVKEPESVKISKNNIPESHDASPKDDHHSRTYASTTSKSTNKKNSERSKTDKETTSHRSRDTR